MTTAKKPTRLIRESLRLYPTVEEEIAIERLKRRYGLQAQLPTTGSTWPRRSKKSPAKLT